MSKLRMRKLKEKFDKEFVLPFQRDVVKPNMTDEIWNWITSTYTPAILEEFAKWRNGEFVLGECRAMIATHEAKKVYHHSTGGQTTKRTWNRSVTGGVMKKRINKLLAKAEHIVRIDKNGNKKIVSVVPAQYIIDLLQEEFQDNIQKC